MVNCPINLPALLDIRMRVRLARISSIFGLLFWLFASTPSHAIDRPLPANAKVGKLSVSDARHLIIDGDIRRLGAGAQVRTQQNIIVQTQTLLTYMLKMGYKNVPILYTENSQGHIHRIWVLTAAEVDKSPLGLSIRIKS